VKKAAKEIFGFDHTSKTIEVPVNSLVAGVLTMLAIVLVWVGSTSDIFHLNLSSILPPPQKSTTAPTLTPEQDLVAQDVTQEGDASRKREAEEVAQAQPDETELIDKQSTAASDEQVEVTTESDSSEQLIVEADASPAQNNIFIAPVEISDRREQEPSTRILINTIEITE
jgi:hypothetical protein